MKLPLTEMSRLDAAGNNAALASLSGTPVLEAGEVLWRRACRNVQQGNLDDRPLYWQRLRQLAHTAAEEQSRLEASSRNYLTAFEAKADFKVLVTGFDPFHLDTNISQSNPSGIIALAVDGARLETGKGLAEIRSMILPVRFRDFDEGLVEGIVDRYQGEIDMLVTVSMGRDRFDLERYPGRRRSSEQPDNENVYAGCSAEKPIVPAGLDGPEFVEFSLPVNAMLDVTGDYEVRDNREIATLSRGDFQAESLTELTDETAVRGSGGGYLSNEISYRVIRRLNESGSNIAAGHIHTPRIVGHDSGALAAIVSQGVDLIRAGVGAQTS